MTCKGCGDEIQKDAYIKTGLCWICEKVLDNSVNVYLTRKGKQT